MFGFVAEKEKWGQRLSIPPFINDAFIFTVGAEAGT
jgi:hypothetical protein